MLLLKGIDAMHLASADNGQQSFRETLSILLCGIYKMPNRRANQTAIERLSLNHALGIAPMFDTVPGLSAE